MSSLSLLIFICHSQGIMLNYATCFTWEVPLFVNHCDVVFNNNRCWQTRRRWTQVKLGDYESRDRLKKAKQTASSLYLSIKAWHVWVRRRRIRGFTLEDSLPFQVSLLSQAISGGFSLLSQCFAVNLFYFFCEYYTSSSRMTMASRVSFLEKTHYDLILQTENMNNGMLRWFARLLLQSLLPLLSTKPNLQLIWQKETHSKHFVYQTKKRDTSNKETPNMTVVEVLGSTKKSQLKDQEKKRFGNRFARWRW